MEHHDVATGYLSHCQVCNSERLELVIDLGHQPLCCTMLTAEMLNEPEETFPLRLNRCLECSLTQLDYIVPGDKVYFPDYPYRCGITREVVLHHEQQSAHTVKRFSIPPGSFVVDIGSNDGTLLAAYQKQGMRVLGVEPTNIGKFAREAGIETITSPFHERLGEEIAVTHGKAKLVTATNVFAHMAALGEVIRGIQKVLDHDGLFMFEVHYLLDIVKKTQYDTIYHEHIRSYTLKSLLRLFDYYNLTVIDAEVVPRYAGTLRVFVANGKSHKVNDSVKKVLEAERDAGLYSEHVYAEFRERCQRAKIDLLELALRAKRSGQSFVGNSCPGRCSTLLNFTGIDADLMPYIAEQPTSLKLGKYLPGKHIPVVVNDRLIEDQPDYVVLLAWHYWEPIASQLRERGLRSKLVIPLPEVRIQDA